MSNIRYASIPQPASLGSFSHFRLARGNRNFYLGGLLFLFGDLTEVLAKNDTIVDRYNKGEQNLLCCLSSLRTSAAALY